MSLISVPFIFTVGAVIVASQHNACNSVIYSDYNGGITDANISPSAAIQYSKLSLGASIKNSDLATAITQALVPSGGIIMWSGTIATIPSGWYLCNGSNGTPDLRNKFIVAADADSSGVAKSTIVGTAAQTGGTTVIDFGYISSGSGTKKFIEDGMVDFNIGTQTVLIEASGAANLYAPPFYSLAYIMKA